MIIDLFPEDSEKRTVSFLEKTHKYKLSTKKLVFSEENLEGIKNNYKIYSNFLQNIHYFSNTGFEIELLVDLVETGDPDSLSRLERTDIEFVFIQFISVYLLKKKFDIKFLNFRKFFIEKNSYVKFKLDPDKDNDEDDLMVITKIFRDNKRFKDIKKNQIIEIFRSLVPLYKFNKNNIWFYNYDDFATSIIDSYPISQLKGNENISIKVYVKDVVKKRFIKNNIFNNFLDKSSLLINIDSNVDDLFQYIYGIFSIKDDKRDSDFEKLFGNIKNFLKESTFTSIIFVIDTILNNKDKEFIRFLFKGSGISKLYFIFFQDVLDGTCDLVLSENGKNYIYDILNTGKRFSSKKNSLSEKKIVKTVRSFPLTTEELNNFLSLSENGDINNLINSGQIEKKDGRLYSPANLRSLISSEEEISILEELLEVFGYPELELKISLKNFEPSRVAEIMDKILLSDLQWRGNRFPFEYLKSLIFKNLEYFRKETYLLKRLILFLIKEMEIELAEDMIRSYGDFSDPFFEIKLCEISLIKMDYEEAEKILSKLKGDVSSELKDDFFLYSFLLNENRGEKKKALGFYNQIESEFNKRIADIKYSGKLMESGDMEKAELFLSGSKEYFLKKGFVIYSLRVLEKISDLEWFKGKKRKALKIRKNLYLQSEIRGYKILAGEFSLGLGKLFLLDEDYGTAEFWFNKAIEIFKKEKINYGIKVARLNYSKIDLVRGHWREAEKNISFAGKPDSSKGNISEPGNYFFYSSLLEYFRHNYSKAKHLSDNSILIFKNRENMEGLNRAKLLNLIITLSAKNGDIFTEDARKQMLNNLEPESPAKNILRVFFDKDLNDKRKEKIIKLLDGISSNLFKFLILELFAIRFKENLFLKHLKVLSSAMSDGRRNYFFYQYYFIYFSLFFKYEKKSKDMKDLFYDTYYFFLDNNRKPDRQIKKVKGLFQEESFEVDVFKNAELVNKYNNWKIPEDLFNSFIEELYSIEKADLIRLAIYEKGKNLFNFKTSVQFEDLLEEVIETSMLMAEESVLNPDDIKRRFKSDEKAFYYYKTTRTYLWKISGEIFGLLLIVDLKEKDHKKNTENKIRELFKSFAPLAANYINIDYKIAKKLGNIIGESLPLKNMKKKILKIGKVDFSLLINGESGSGKELVAKAVHLIGKRSEGPFIPINSASIPVNLLESELFGYKKGAFTDAKEDRAGLIEAADGGTLFLDEIGELPPDLQAKLLRVLQERELKRLGENFFRKVDIRFIFATNKDLKKMIEKGTFREDLFYRIQDLVINVPALRERVEDIPLIAGHFMKKYGFSFNSDEEFDNMVEEFKSRDWPGNIRELESNIKRIITYYPDNTERKENEEKQRSGLISARERFEKDYLLKILKKNNWNKSKSAVELRISRPYLFTLLKKHDLEIEK